MARKKKIWTQERLDTLYECWKAGETTKDRIPHIVKNLSDIPLPIAVSMMRKLARIDSKWIGWVTRKTNEKERSKVVKKQEKERKQQEREQRRKEREERKIDREKRRSDKEIKQKLNNDLELDHTCAIAEKVRPEFFFCPDIHQFVNNNACIFKVFSKKFPSDSVCTKCKRMDKYIPIIEEVVKDVRPKKRAKGEARNGNKDKA